MKRKHMLILAGLFLLLVTGMASILLPVQNGIRETAHEWEGERTVREPYVLETIRKDAGEVAYASFRIRWVEDDSICYTCPNLWRTMDLKSIDWTEEGYDIAVRFGDVGTVTYFHSEDGWQSEEDGKLALRAAEGETLSPELILAPTALEEILKGGLTAYARLRSDGFLFEWLCSERPGETPGTQEAAVVISRLGAEGPDRPQVFPLKGVSMERAALSMRLGLLDMDFDGQRDLKVYLGRTGEAELYYACFLRREDGFEYCESYEALKNPRPDSAIQRIRANGEIYAYIDGEFIPYRLPGEEPPTLVTDLPEEENGRLAIGAGWKEELPETLLLASFGEARPDGILRGYARLRVDGWLFEWVRYNTLDEYYNPDNGWGEQRLLISKESPEGPVGTKIYVTGDLAGFPDADADEKLLFVDVNFDGNPDILVCLGHFGNQGLVRYDCFLQGKNGFTHCESFSDIPNPSIDVENRMILSQMRHWALSHGWGKYQYRNGAFVRVAELTEEPCPESWGQEEENLIWQWTEETLQGGEMVQSRCWRSDAYTREELEDIIYNENSDWGLLTDRWRVLYNGGRMADFSIYGE